jgi:hypothetical protein
MSTSMRQNAAPDAPTRLTMLIVVVVSNWDCGVAMVDAGDVSNRR